ncbi:MAG: hypothetical protein ACOCX2_06325, partial [Armatimonadota bacterium]
MTTLTLIAVLVALAIALAMPEGPNVRPVPDRGRVDQIARMLPDAPEGLGKPIIHRDAWDALAVEDAYQEVIARAESICERPLPAQPDELYLEFSHTGNRVRCQDVQNERRGRIAPLVLAECVEDRGRFLPVLEELVAELCAERTWVRPAHDRDLANFRGERVTIDLLSSALAWHLATANWLLAERLSAGARAAIRAKVDEFVLDPVREILAGRREPMGWMRATNNWNAVCLAGVTGAALAQVRDRGERAEFVAAAEQYSKNFLAGFGSDGYCSEGLGYWNYGFGNYILLSETVHQATGGGLDLMDRPGVALPATFGPRIHIANGVVPAFADCAIDATPDPRWMYYINRRYDLGLHEYDALPLNQPLRGHHLKEPEAAGPRPNQMVVSTSLPSAVIFSFPNSAREAETLDGPGIGSPLRSWFEDADVLVARTAGDADGGLNVAIKGGHNGEMHNHNDVGSWVAVVGDTPLLLDPGLEVYTARTFSDRRYESGLLNSWGHQVPVVAGRLQQTGEHARASVVARQFSDERDTLVLDLSAAYDVPALTRLERRFVYDRADGSLVIEDSVQFEEPAGFEGALVTFCEWYAVDDGTLVVEDSDQRVAIRVDTRGVAWELVA